MILLVFTSSWIRFILAGPLYSARRRDLSLARLGETELTLPDCRG
jgi:hypothetical protein